MNTETILNVVGKHRGERGALIAILQDIQSKYGYLPAEALKIVASETGHTMVDIYGIATFYRSFRLKPRGKHMVSVCLGTACHVRGGPIIAEEFERQLDTRVGGTTTDKEFSLETVNCLGACALGPIVVIDGHYFSNVDTAKVKQLVRKARAGLDKVGMKGEQTIFPVEVSCPRCNHSLMNAKHLLDGYPVIHVTISFGHQHGWLRLSSLYGSYTIESEHEIPMDAVVNIFCPHCHAELVGASNCTECEAPMVPMIVRGGGIVQICSRRGCKSHMLDLNGVNL
ncbi:MAG: NAD(P)H-dependent oxidoreductase subunit E [candidate division KSB1 bacterium]|nr:NAD(P)H-dependent oxidoreductase subunit E [candidate division KSB1 bacterium]MDZ7303346.1 NAD(P)H-dependent oxidoreductase subunit E [candidate division KSB1 bacterium]MDZ7310404.1 NAD(P)H-dependent oxidoreductase subunit E [candidate division KSB1 bacterium]